MTHYFQAAYLCAATAVVLPRVPAQAPSLVMDINPGAASGLCPCPTGITTAALGSTLFFGADDGVNGWELWTTDGTQPGTEMIELVPGPPGSAAGGFVVCRDAVVFTANHPASGFEIWRTDGTINGTYLLRDVAPGLGWGVTTQLVAVGDLVFFQGGNVTSGRELWRTDGTTQGTVLVKDIAPGSNNSNPSHLTELDGRLYFVVVLNGRHELWTSDGTSQGTTMVKDGFSDSLTDLTTASRTLWFTHQDDPIAHEVWCSDGSTAGTVLVKSFPYSAFYHPEDYTAVGSTVFFTADDGIHGNELWKSDGTPGGAEMVADLKVGSSAPYGLIELGGKLLFGAATPDFDLWTTDGTAEGTELLSEATLGESAKSGLRSVYFSGDGELWTTDGTIEGTREIAGINPTGPSTPTHFAFTSGELFFIANDGVTGRELWKIFPGATSEELGYACAAPGTYPRLRATDPAWGATWSIAGTGFAPGTAVWLLSSFEVAPSVLGTCTLFVDPNAFGIFHAQVVTSPDWSVALPLPTIPALLGVSVVLQAVQAPTAAPLGADITNAVVSTFGA